jgi:3-oxoacyl-[acyl-carrier-protein] synthase III
MLPQLSEPAAHFLKSRVTNDDIVDRLEKDNITTNDQWIRDRTGIRERRFSNLDNPTNIIHPLAWRRPEGACHGRSDAR